MELGYDAAIQEFEDLIPSHVAPAFAAATDIVALLQRKGVKVFVPQNWEGVNEFEPLKLTWLPGLPTSMKPKARPVNPKLYEHARKEYERLSKYFYAPSSSPKATAPFIRFCWDYVAINKYLATGHFPIPHVQRSLEKISKFTIFLDFDMVNSYYQFKLDDETSERLSIQTLWEQVKSLFMPEDFSEWSIVILDNFLVLAHDLVPSVYGKLLPKNKINLVCPLFGEQFHVDNVFISRWGSLSVALTGSVIVDEAFALQTRRFYLTRAESGYFGRSPRGRGSSTAVRVLSTSQATISFTSCAGTVDSR